MDKRFIPLVVFVVLSVVLYVVVDDFVQQMLVKPVLYVSWLVAFLLGSLPQLLFWIVFIIIAAILAGKSVSKEEGSRPPTGMPKAVHRGPVATWFVLLERAETQVFTRWRLSQALRNLARDLSVPKDDGNQQSQKGYARRPTLDLPPEIEAYFNAPVPRYQRAPWLRFYRGGNKQATALDLPPENIVKYLEEELDPLRGE